MCPPGRGPGARARAWGARPGPGPWGPAQEAPQDPGDPAQAWGAAQGASPALGTPPDPEVQGLGEGGGGS